MQIKLIFLLKNIKIFYFSFDFAIIIVVISEIITIFAALKQTYKMVGTPLSTGTKVAMTWRLGFGSTKYGFDLSGDFIGLEYFITTLLDNINVFSIPLFRNTIEEYGLNVWGQILYFY